jgi:hypothetical protein
MTSKQLGEHLGLTDRRIRQILDLQKIKAIRRGEYDTTGALVALCNYFQGLAEKNTDSYAIERQLLTKARREKVQFEIEQLRKEYFKATEVASTITMLAKANRGLLQRMLESELPPKLLGLSVPEIAERMQQTVNDICEFWQSGIQQYADMAALREVNQSRCDQYVVNDAFSTHTKPKPKEIVVADASSTIPKPTTKDTSEKTD